MKFDDKLIRDLNRIVNDRDVLQMHRNVARRAVEVLLAMDNSDEATDPNMVNCICIGVATTDTASCVRCDGAGIITRDQHREILKEREEHLLRLQEVAL